MNEIPDGYYAVPDPDNPQTMTYWRYRNGSGQRWPAKAWYGPPRLLKRDAPTDRDELNAWGRAWNERYFAWHDRVIAAIAAAPDECRARFAALATRCSWCARTLTDEKSKLLGYGPDCRRALQLDDGALAETVTPLIAAAHAGQQATAAPDAVRQEGTAS